MFVLDCHGVARFEVDVISIRLDSPMPVLFVVVGHLVADQRRRRSAVKPRSGSSIMLRSSQTAAGVIRCFVVVTTARLHERLPADSWVTAGGKPGTALVVPTLLGYRKFSNLGSVVAGAACGRRTGAPGGEVRARPLRAVVRRRRAAPSPLILYS